MAKKKNTRMDLGSLRALLDSERAGSMSATGADTLSTERKKALDYYMGDKTLSGDMPTLENQSEAVSNDVADTVDGLMPGAMKILCGGNEVVKFEPTGPEDIAAAEQETDYVNHVAMQMNPGFMVIYNFCKDAFLSKTGIVKVGWECREEEIEESYDGLDDMQFDTLINEPDVELIEHTEHPDPIDDDPGSTPISDPALN